MRLETSEPEEIKLNMTAMIDIVFQLLVFFIMTFKVVAMEGDFNIKMPLAGESAAEVDELLPDLIQVTMTADAEGRPASLEVNDGSETQTLPGPFFASVNRNGATKIVPSDEAFAGLTRYVEGKLAGEANPEEGEETEVEFDIAWDVRYAYTVKAIEAVSGRVLPNGEVKKLIEKIKFRDNTR